MDILEVKMLSDLMMNEGYLTQISAGRHMFLFEECTLAQISGRGANTRLSLFSALQTHLIQVQDARTTQ